MSLRQSQPENLVRLMLAMINDTHERSVNSISDQTFRFNYINWLLLGEMVVCLETGRQSSDKRYVPLKVVLFSEYWL